MRLFGKDKSRRLCGLLIADTQAGSKRAVMPPGLGWELTDWQDYLWSKWENMLEIVPPKLDFAVHLAEVLQGPAAQKGSTAELHTNVLHEQAAIAKSLLEPIIDRVEMHPDGTAKSFWMCRGSMWHEGEYGDNVELLAQLLGAHEFDGGEYTGDVLELFLGDDEAEAITCEFSHHQSVFMIYFSTPLERELKFLGEQADQVEIDVDGEPRGVIPDLIARAHTHRHVQVERFIRGQHKVAVTVPGWQLQIRYTLKSSVARAWSSRPGFTLVWLDPEAKKRGRRCIWTETITYDHPRRRAIKLA